MAYQGGGGGTHPSNTTLACDERHPVILQNACTSSTCSNSCHPTFNTWADASSPLLKHPGLFLQGDLSYRCILPQNPQLSSPGGAGGSLRGRRLKGKGKGAL